MKREHLPVSARVANEPYIDDQLATTHGERYDPCSQFVPSPAKTIADGPTLKWHET